ncbi:MAG: hypothetical protein EOM14_16675, partial [Clostridia bacterium]|nr:hypothetical protein [Clostridia bacterium]
MTVTEKAAYLKGLMAGLNMDASTGESKMFTAIVDLLEDLEASDVVLPDLDGGLIVERRGVGWHLEEADVAHAVELRVNVHHRLVLVEEEARLAIDEG